MNIRMLYGTVAKFPLSLMNFLVALSSFTRINNFLTSETSNLYSMIRNSDENPNSIEVNSASFTWNNSG